MRLEFVADAAAQTPAQIQEREGRAALVAARQAFGEDPTVKALQERFGATAVTGYDPTRREPILDSSLSYSGALANSCAAISAI